jgi:hypothetical protein
MSLMIEGNGLLLSGGNPVLLEYTTSRYRSTWHTMFDLLEYQDFSYAGIYTANF